MPIFDQKHRQITGDSPVDITSLLTPQEPEPSVIPQPIQPQQRGGSVMEDIGLGDPLGQTEAQTPEGKAIQGRVAGRKNVRVLENILGEGTPQVQERRRERLGIAETVDIKSLPGIQTGGSKKIAEAIQHHLQNLSSNTKRATGLEEQVLASSEMSSNLSDRFHAIAKQYNKEFKTESKTINGQSIKGKENIRIDENFDAITEAMEQEDPSLFQIGKNILGGLADAERKYLLRPVQQILGGFSGAPEPLSVGIEKNIGFDVPDVIPDTSKYVREQFSLENPGLVNEFFGTLGNSAFYMVPSTIGQVGGDVLAAGGSKMMGVTGNAQLLKVAAPQLAQISRITGGGIMTAIESLAEAGDAYQTAIQMGFSEEEAVNISHRVLVANISILSFTNTLGLAGRQASPMKRLLLSMPLESLEEVLQTKIANRELGLPEWEGTLKSGIFGGLIGLILGGATIPINVVTDIDKYKRGGKDRLDGESNPPTPNDIISIAAQAEAKEGRIGGDKVLRFKPKKKNEGVGRESREIQYTGPEDLSVQEAREIGLEYVERQKAVDEQTEQDPETVEAESKDTAIQDKRSPKRKTLTNDELADLLPSLIGSTTEEVGKGGLTGQDVIDTLTRVEEQTGNVFRQLNQSDVRSILNGRNPKEGGDTFFASERELAISQDGGSKTNPILEFSRENLQLRDHKGKPALDFTGGELVTSNAGPDFQSGVTGEDLLNSLKSVTFKEGSLSNTENKRLAGVLELKGFTKTKTKKGTVFTKKKPAKPKGEQKILDTLLDESISEQERAANERLEESLPEGMLKTIKENKSPNRTQLLEQRKMIKEGVPPGEMQDKMLADINKLLKKGETATNAAKRRAREQTKRADRAETALKAQKKKVQKLKKIAAIKRIKNELRTSKAKKQSGKPVGLYTPSIQKGLDILRVAAGRKESENNTQMAINLGKSNKVTGILDEKLVLENRFISLVNGLEGKSVSELGSILDVIKDIKARGKNARFIADQAKNELFASNLKTGMNVLTGGKGIPASMKTTGIKPIENKGIRQRSAAIVKKLKSVQSWWDLLDRISSKDDAGKIRMFGPSKENKSFLNTNIGNIRQAKTDEKNAIESATIELADMYQKSYNFKSNWKTKFGKKKHIEWQMFKKMNEDNKEVSLGEFTTEEGELVELKFSRAEARKRWAELQDPSLDRTWEEGMGYTPEIKRAISEFLTPQDKAFATAQIAFYQKIYKRVNPVYERMYGVTLPFNEFYTPIRREGFTVESEDSYGEFLGEMKDRMSVAPSGTKSRVMSILPIVQRSDVAVIQQHVAQMEHFISHVEKVQEMRMFFDNANVRAAIHIFHGEKERIFIESFLDDFTRGGADLSHKIGWMDNIRVNVVRAALMGRGIITLKQLTSTPTFMDSMPVHKYIQYSAEFWVHPVRNTRILYKDSASLRSRGSSMERDIKEYKNRDQYKLFKKNLRIGDTGMLNVYIGDQSAIVIGGWPYYRYMTKDLGFSHIDAIAELESQFESTQTSADTDQQNYYQRLGSFSKAFTVFMHSPIQYSNKMINAIRNMLVGRKSVKDTAKTLAIYQVIIPTLFQLVGNLGRWDKDDQKRAIILGPWNSLIVYGQFVESLVRMLAGDKVFPPSTPVLSQTDGIMKAYSNLTEKDIDEVDLEDAILGLLDSAGSFTGKPFEQVGNFMYGTRDMINGEYEKGLLRTVLGATKYQAETKAYGKSIEKSKLDLDDPKDEAKYDKELDRRDAAKVRKYRAEDRKEDNPNAFDKAEDFLLELLND